MSRYYAEDFHDTSLVAAEAKTGLLNADGDIEGAGCFVAGTKIFTSLGWKPIEKIKRGTIVVAYDAFGNIEHGYVQQLHIHKKDQQKDSIIRFTLADETVLTVTANHGMWQDNEDVPFVEARELRIGDSLYNMQGEPVEITGRKVTALKRMDEDFCSYNLSVSPQHTYIAEGIKVHNGGGDKSGQQRTPVESPNTLRSKAVAKIQEVISEGEIDGLVDDGRSLFFDDTPILNPDDSPNFEDVSFFFFNGTPDQESMPGFSNVEAEQVVNIEMVAGNPGVVQTMPSGTDAARVTIQLPGGLYFTNTETGDIGGHTVDVRIETRLTGGSFEEQMTDTITGKTMTVYERDYRIDAPVPYDGIATWEIRVSRQSPVDAKVTTKSVTFWARVTEIQEIEIAYENTCIAGLQVDSKSTGGNIPIRSYDIKGIKMQIPTNYDPLTRIYDGPWSGEFKIEWTDNPAWVVYDVLTSTRYGLGEFIDADTIDRFSFFDAAQYNDELVDDGDGGTEPRFTFNTQLATQEDSWKLVQSVASSMRATVLPGTILSLLQDRPASVVKLINNSNVIDGMFSYTGSALSSRNTAAHVTYNEPTDRYLPRTVTEEDSTGISRYGFNPIDLAAFGCTSEGQARRLAKWVLDTELNTAEVCVFQVALDNADLLPGDIIEIMDQDYVGLLLAGRVAGGSTTVIDLDREVTLESGEVYTFSVMSADNSAVLERTVTTPAGDVTQITVTPALTDTGVALKNQTWSLNSDIGVTPRQFRVLFMTESEKGRFEISCSEHDPGKYDRVETGIVLPDPVYSDLPGSVCAEISNLTYEVQAYTDPNFGQQVKLIVKWDHVDEFSHMFKIMWRVENGNFTDPIYRQEKEFEITNILPGTFEVMINAINTRGVSSVPVIDDFLYAPGVNNTMDPPINLIITPDSQDTSNITFATPDLTFRFENNPDNDDVGGQDVFGGISGYRIIIEDASNNELEVRDVAPTVTNDGAFFIQTFTFADNVASTGGPHREMIVKVYTKTADGAISTVAETKTFTNPFPPAPGATILENPDGAFVQATPTGSNKDTAGMVVVMKDTGGNFTPVEGDIIYSGPDLATQIPFGAPFESRSIRVAVFDDFTFVFGDLNFSTFAIQVGAPWGIRSVTTLPTLPSVFYPDGVTVFLTTDAKLYRVTMGGTVWDRSADGGDLTPNSVTTNEILAGTILAADIATGTITAASAVIADATIGTLQLINDAASNITAVQVGSSSSTILSPIDVWLTLANAVINVDGDGRGIVNIAISLEVTAAAVSGNQFISARIRRVTGPTTVLWEGLSDADLPNKSFAQIKGSYNIVDTLAPTGNTTYQLQVFASGTVTAYSFRTSTLTLTELKK